MSKEKLMRLAERVLKRTESYQNNREMEIPEDENYKLDYLLIKGSKSAPADVMAYASYEDMVLLMHPLEENASEQAIWDWSFNLDSDLFGNLEDGYELAGMSLSCHYCVWCTIGDWHESDIEYTDGMQRYLDYCKKNGITKELLQEKLPYDGMDVMSLYDKEASKSAKPPKGYER